MDQSQGLSGAVFGDGVNATGGDLQIKRAVYTFKGRAEELSVAFSYSIHRPEPIRK
jgi:hypothetical protein